MMFSEKQIETKLRRLVRESGGQALKFVSPGQAGMPDRIILMPNGKFYFVELKSPRGKVSPIQNYMFDKLAKLGFDVTIISSVEGVYQFMSEITNEDS